MYETTFPEIPNFCKTYLNFSLAAKFNACRVSRLFRVVCARVCTCVHTCVVLHSLMSDTRVWRL